MTVTTISADELRDLELFAGLPADQLAWIVEHGDCVSVAQGKRLISRGDPAEFMFVVVEGVIQRYEEIAGQWLLVATTRPGQVTGMLPFSRMTHYPGHMVAAEPARILRLKRSNFVEMLGVSTELGQRLVARMSDRVRGDVRLEQQREKMAALGRLSAGLAHELNNPAAAASRAAASLASEFDALRAVVFALVRRQPDEATMAKAEALMTRVLESPAPVLSAFDRSDREEDLVDWLDAHGVSQAWEVAGPFVDAGLSVQDFDEFAATIPTAMVADALAWVGCGLSVNRTVRLIGTSMKRITELVASVKTYSHMDRSTEHKPTDVREGLDHTLVMFGHRLRDGRIVLTRDYTDDVPAIPANAGELNQVWTNLIDNALDALGGTGELRVAVSVEDSWVCVEIADNGSGIPEDLRHRIFDPFFTTKGVGEGTGLGLDIALRIITTHQGQIDLQSEPGRTVFRVRLPVAPKTLTTAG